MTKKTLKIPKVIFVDSPKLRANYVCFLARQITAGFYQSNNYTVLSRFVPDARTVFFPNLNFKNSFWRKIKAAKPGNVASLYPESLLSEIESQAGALSTSPDRQIEWSKISEKFWLALISTHLFDKEIMKVRSVTVHPTTFGTGSSFSFNTVRGKPEVFITLRADSNVSSIANSIIKCLLMIGNEKYRENFAARQEISAFLFGKTKLSNIKKVSTKLTPSLSAKLQKESKDYLAELGFVAKNPFSKNGTDILVNGKLARNHLSPQEMELLTLLLDEKGKSASLEVIAQTIWKHDSEQKFSLWAITKLKQKLDKKLRSLGAGSHIQSIRNQGYTLS